MTYIETIKQVCRLVHKLCYTSCYKVTLFRVQEYDDKDTQIDFEITRRERFSGEISISYSTGTVYVTKKGKLYYLNYAGDKKPVKQMGTVATRFMFESKFEKENKN